MMSSKEVSSLPKAEGSFKEEVLGEQKRKREETSTVLSIIEELRSKPQWEKKATDPNLKQKYRQEAIDQGASVEAIDLALGILETLAQSTISFNEAAAAEPEGTPDEVDLNLALVDLPFTSGTPIKRVCKSRIKLLSKQEIKTWRCSPIEIANNVQMPVLTADGILPAMLSQSLLKHLDELLKEKPLDLHPGSNMQVADLIHPSLYPYISGVTMVEDEEALGKCAPVHSGFAWLPSEFEVTDNRSVQINSYINNLDRATRPKLYQDIGFAFKAMLPMFETALGKDLTSTKLQVIVKAAYYLIPPGTSYQGSWHVEGMPHEHIIASGICYLDVSDNILNNNLEFRKQIPEAHFMSQDNQHRPNDEVSLIEQLGRVPTPSKRALVWNNSLQHCVDKLTVKVNPRAAQPSKTGIRKILCFFLVDPNVEVVSTKLVAPQQDAMSNEKAMEYRQKLMNERKFQVDKVTQDWESMTYTFCEH